MNEFAPTLDLHLLFILISGFAMLGMAYLPRLLNQRPLSLPIIYVIMGALLYLLPLGLPIPKPMENGNERFVLEVLTEILVIASLSAVGLALDRRITWRGWESTWRLLGITMPLCVLALGAMGYGLLGLPLAAAVLLGGVLAPTDPVLAADVQVEELNDDDGNEVRFALTSEAGLNDGLAFPFIHLALALVGTSLSTELVTNWLSYDVGYRIMIGVFSGVLIGRALAWLAFRGSDEARDRRGRNAGLVVISATFLAYGITEVFHGYGFLATFLAAVSVRHEEERHEYHHQIHSFIDQSERLLLSVMLIAFGGILLGGVLDALNWKVVLVAAIFLLLVRPIAGLIGFIGYDMPWQEKLAVSFFGIRGMGSLYYLAYAANHADFEGIETVWAAVSITILMSIVLHGASATPVMRYLELLQSPAARRRHTPQAPEPLPD